MDQRNMILAFALSMVVLLGWGALFPEAETPPVVQKSATLDPTGLTPPAGVVTQAAGAVNSAESAAPVASTASFKIANDLLELTISDQGRFTHASLLQFKDTLEGDSENVSVLKSGDGHSVYVNSGIQGRRIATPFSVLEQNGSSITLQATLDDGRLWQQQVTLSDGSYLINVNDRVIDGSGMKMYRQVVERNPDRDASTFYEHMGPTALLNGKLIEPAYDDLDEKGAERMASMGGWTSIMNRYFIAALISNPEQDYPYYFKSDGRSYQAGLIDDGTVEGRDAVFSSKLFVGPKSIPVLETVGAELERSVDFGWFAPISQPMHTGLVWLYQYFGNYGWCIIVLVIGIKILFFYPTQKSYESMAGMRKLQPEMARLKEQYGDDRQRMGQEVMTLYKKHKVNPLGGCLPILIQIPVFFALYKVLLMSIEMRQAPFIGWIEDMSVQDPYFVLPVLMGISMFIQQRLNPQPPDPIQAKVMQFLPFMFTAMFLFFPAGLVLYWVVNNVLSIVQQRLVMKRMNVD